MSDRPVSLPTESGSFVSRHIWVAYLLLIVTMLFFAGTTVIGRAVRADIPPVGLVFWRSIIATAILLPFVASRLRDQLPLIQRHWKVLFAMGLAQTIGGQGVLYISLQTTTALNAGMITATQPAIILVLAWLVLGDAITWRQGLGILIAVIGAFTIISQGSVATFLGLDLVIGDLWVQLATVSWATYAILVKRAPPELNPFVLFVAMTAGAIVVLIPLYIGEMVLTGRTVPFNLLTAGTLLYVAGPGSILALVFLNTGIKHMGPGRASVFFYLVPVFTALLAIVLLGEVLHTYHFIAIALVFTGVFLAGRARRQPLRDRPPPNDLRAR